MNAVVGESLVWRPSGLTYVYVPADTWQLRTSRGGVSIPSLGEGSGYYTGGPGPLWGVRDSAGVQTSTGGPEPPAVRAERPLLPEHVVLPDLYQQGDGFGTVVG